MVVHKRWRQVHFIMIPFETSGNVMVIFTKLKFIKRCCLLYLKAKKAEFIKKPVTKQTIKRHKILNMNNQGKVTISLGDLVEDEECLKSRKIMKSRAHPSCYYH